MELKELKNYIMSNEIWNLFLHENIKPLSNDELDAIQYDLETEMGVNNSVWDYILTFITFRKKIAELEEENKTTLTEDWGVWDGCPRDNKINYCPKCGRKIEFLEGSGE